MAKDPAFLYYDGDASKDVAHMNRLERGCYLDIIHAQKKFGRLSLVILKKILGKDFDDCWPSLELVLTKVENLFFIGWLEESILARKEHSEKQKKRIKDYWNKKNDTTVKPRNSHGSDAEVPLENEIEDENVIENVSLGGPGDFSFDLKTKIPAKTLESAELSQFTMTKNRNTDFVNSQWVVFLSERTHDPPAKRYRNIQELSSYFLNWIRNKHPTNGTHRQTNSAGNSTGKLGTSAARNKASREY